MKSYVVFSDIHGDVYAKKILQEYVKNSDGAFFAGDGLSGLNDFTNKPFYAVMGNCDRVGDEEKIIEVDGVKILLTHGHLYGVKSSYLRLIYKAKELGVDVVIFGHTHQPLIMQEEEILLLNPGSCSIYGAQKTFINLFISNNKASAVINQLEK
ncbi:MAG: metallophosphoesterase [Clostridia bacterium]|nr:metallophosphoesterase [Clostridia bacterium]